MQQIGFTNFRKFEYFPTLDLGKITFLVGSNNTGKSSMVKALILALDYVKLKNMRKEIENADFAHNAICPYKELDEYNKKCNKFKTGNVPKIYRLFDKISYDTIRNKDVVYPNDLNR